MRRAAEGAPLAAVALLIALSALGPAAKQARALIWERYVNYTSPFLGTWPSGVARPPRAQRIVIVVVHGLRLAESQGMPMLNALRQRGADITIELRPPAYDLPATLTWLSGAQPEVHGATSNQSLLLTRPQTIVQAAQSAGWVVTFVGSEQRHDWLGGAQRAVFVDDLAPAQRDEQAVALALEVLGTPSAQPQIIIVSLDLITQIARQNPESYSAAVAATDFRIQQVLAQVNLEAETLVVLSERGIARSGYDGGGEAEVVRVPLVMAGAGVVAGSVAVAPATAIAPTLAALAGAPFPIHAQSGFIFEALDVDPPAFIASAQQLTAFYDQWSAIVGQPRFAADLLRRYGDRLAAGDRMAYAVWQATLGRAAAEAADARLRAERATRLPLVIGLGLLLLILTGLFLNDWVAGPLVGLLGYAVAWLIVFFAIRREPLSLSLFPEGVPDPAFATWERLSAALMGGSAVVVVVLGAGRRSGLLEAIIGTLSALGLMAIAQAAVVLAFYWQWGDSFTWALPDSSWLVAALLALTQLGAFLVQALPASPALPLPLLVALLCVLIYPVVRR